MRVDAVNSAGVCFFKFCRIKHSVLYYCYQHFTLYRFLLLRIYYAMTTLIGAYLEIFLDLTSAGV